MSATMVLALLLLFGCGAEGPEPGRVERVGGTTYRTGQAIRVDLGERERFRHRYRFHGERGTVVPIQAETGGMVLEIAIGPPGERAEWNRGPQSEIRDRFTVPETGVYELVISGDSLTFGNSYRMVVGQR